MNVLNVVDSVFELKTILDYFDSLYNDFDKERITKKLYEEYKRSILIKVTKLEKINNELYRKIDDIKYSYDLTDEEVAIIGTTILVILEIVMIVLLKWKEVRFLLILN